MIPCRVCLLALMASAPSKLKYVILVKSYSNGSANRASTDRLSLNSVHLSLDFRYVFGHREHRGIDLI